MIVRYLDGIDRALFDEGPGGFVALSAACALWAFELVMNLRGGTGWVYWAHLFVVSPPWAFLLALLLRGLWRRLAPSRRRPRA